MKYIFADQLTAGDILADGRIVEYVSTHDGMTFIRCDEDSKVWRTRPSRQFEVK